MNSEPYSFCFLRYVHDPLSGEFANVGVLLWAPKSRFLGFAACKKWQRLSRFFHGFHQEDYRSLIGRIERSFESLALEYSGEHGTLPIAGEPESARDLAFKVVPFDDAALQWSPSGGGIASSPSAELEQLFNEAVARHYDIAEEARRDDAMVYREIYRAAFESPIVKPRIGRHRIVAPHVEHEFPQAWQNGVWNVYQTLSFDMKRGEDIKNKALRWESLTRFLVQARGKPKIHLLLAAPKEDHRKEYEQARDVLNANKVARLVEENEAADFARELEEQIRATVG